MKKAILSLTVLSCLSLLYHSCKPGVKEIPVDNPSIIDMAPKFEAPKKNGILTKADKVALKNNGNEELKGELIAYNGVVKQMEDFQGKPKLIGLWASWCGPCIKEKPFFKQLSLDYPQIEFFSLSVDEKLQQAEAYFHNRRIEIEDYDYWIGNKDENHLKWYTFRSLDGGTGNAASISLPTYVLIGADGKIISNELPMPSSGEIEKHLDGL